MDVTLETIIALIVLAGLIALANSALNRGKKIRCPVCAEPFNSPSMDKGPPGMEWRSTFRGFGYVKCPKCGFYGRRGRFAEVT